MRYLFGIFYATLFGVKWLWEKLAGEMVAISIATALIYAYHYGCWEERSGEIKFIYFL